MAVPRAERAPFPVDIVRPRGAHGDGGCWMTEDLTSVTRFRKARVRMRGREVLFIGVDIEGRVVAERIERGHGGALIREITSPPLRVEDWPPCACGHERNEHASLGSDECVHGRASHCACPSYRAEGSAPTIPQGGGS